MGQFISSGAFKMEEKTPTLDEIDRRILVELQRDGRLTNQDLAGRIGVSASPCWRR
ncbi:MAG: Lrp/AsnC family transcriptional regulator, partial [Alphaproteobacteria bacterium]